MFEIIKSSTDFDKILSDGYSFLLSNFYIRHKCESFRYYDFKLILTL